VNGWTRATWLNVKASYWFIPSVLTILAFALALATVAIDRNGGSEWLASLGWFEPSRPAGARAQLTVIASAAMTISSTVFAITIAAVAYASGNYGPRLLTNFMNDRGNQVSLGIFIATFVYNLMILRVVRDPQSGAANALEAAAFVPQVSMVVSTATVVVAVGFLVYFLHHVPASIRINSVLGGIGRHLIADIEARFPMEDCAEEPPPPPPQGKPVTATAIGYVEIVDFKSLDRIACEEGRTVALAVRTGDFVHPHLPLVTVSGAEPDEALQDRLRACFSLGDSRTPTQDLEFLIDELVEIALRALSPGVNDPFTAITSIHWMGAAMAKLADRGLREGPEQGSYDPARVRPTPDDFRHFLQRSFGGVRHSAAANVNAALIFVDALCGVARGAASEKRRQLLLDEARTLILQAEKELDGPALEEVRSRLQRFEEAMRAGEFTRAS
jgi:uncharacterized membrane protein